MIEMSVRRDLQPLVTPMSKRGGDNTARSHLVAIVSDRSFSAVVIFALTGLLLTLGVTMLWPAADWAILSAPF